MDIKKIKLIYFSATGTTRKVLESIAEGAAIEDVDHINLTLPEGAQQTIPPFSDELVIMGAPVYGGRLPAIAIERFKLLKANNTPAVIIVLYGNREFEDSLLELKDLAIELGFIPVAGAAFVGEHSFATEDNPIANGRPDGMDVKQAKDFGVKIKEKVSALRLPDARMDLKIPGRFPYEGGPRDLAAVPVTKEDTCTVCGTCASVCPTAAISINRSVDTENELCIRCSACIKQCPEGARSWEDEMMKKIANWLTENCGDRKEPQIFGIDV